MQKLLSLLVFIFIIGPFCTLLHEIGHGLGALLISQTEVHIYLGKNTEHNKETFELGRLHFHLQWSFAVGFTHWESGFDKRQKAMAIAGGPIMSLLLFLLFSLLALSVSQRELSQLINLTATFNLIQFVISMFPINYPRWLVGYRDFPSDGLQLLHLLKKH